MADRVPFLEADINWRWDRQDGQCARCGKTLEPYNRDKSLRGAWHAHHIDGDPSNSTAHNLAILCINTPNCHLWAHHGNTSSDAVVPRNQLPLLGD